VPQSPWYNCDLLRKLVMGIGWVAVGLMILAALLAGCDDTLQGLLRRWFLGAD
jgi:hypothetical protein